MNSMMRIAVMVTLVVVVSTAWAGQVAEEQKKWVPKYEKQANCPKPGDMLINSDPEPDTCCGFTSLFNGKNLDGWKPYGGHCTFEVKDGAIVGTCVKKSPSTYLSTVKDDYADFIFTAELKWEVDGNSGVMFRAQPREDKKGTTVMGPQVEMEGFAKERYWSGGIYGQGCGGWYYPLWLDAHKAARGSLKKDDWNRVTIMAKGETVKTWLNGNPAAHWTTDTYLKGFFGLQIHSGTQGTVHFRNIKVKEL